MQVMLILQILDLTLKIMIMILTKKTNILFMLCSFFFSHFEMKNISFIYHLNKINK